MGERTKAPADATSEAVATTGLFAIFIAIIAIAVSLASLGSSDVGTAVAAGVVAALSFTSSIYCFAMQARDRAEQDSGRTAAQAVPAAA
jgi:membrane protein implicated in regulation of membrane protease activity